MALPVLVATAAGALYVAEKVGDWINEQRGVTLQPYAPTAPVAPAASMTVGVGLVLVGIAAWWIFRGRG